MNKTWMIVIGIIAIAIIAFLILKGGSEKEVTTTTNTTTSTETNGLIGAIGSIWGGIAGALGGGDKDEPVGTGTVLMN